MMAGCSSDKDAARIAFLSDAESAGEGTSEANRIQSANRPKMEPNNPEK
jgi:hypothetical protein